MTDKFPEAFRRFEKSVDIYDLRFSDIIRAFSSWQHHDTSSLQERCISQQLSYVKTSWRLEKIKYKFGERTVYRDIKTGRFTKGIYTIIKRA
jgi:hypothetical protein